MPLLNLHKITKRYRKGGCQVLKEVSLSVESGEIVGLVGESGSGKSTLGQISMGLLQPDSGLVEVAELCKMQIVFQQPRASLNPRMRVLDIVVEGIDIHRLARGSERMDRAETLLHQVGLESDALYKYPHQFSGGQQQRIAIARALAVEPQLLILDEPLSALDLSVQAQVVNLLLELQQRFALSYLLIAHDLTLIRHLCHRVAVLYRGELVENRPTQELFSHPSHPYTQQLLAANPIADPRRERERLAKKR